MEKVRGISDGELMFCDVQELVNSYTIQFLVEFTGNISIKEIEDTINEIVTKNPGSYVFKNKNNWFVSKDRIYVKELLLILKPICLMRTFLMKQQILESIV